MRSASVIIAAGSLLAIAILIPVLSAARSKGAPPAALWLGAVLGLLLIGISAAMTERLSRADPLVLRLTRALEAIALILLGALFLSK